MKVVVFVDVQKDFVKARGREDTYKTEKEARACSAAHGRGDSC